MSPRLLVQTRDFLLSAVVLAGLGGLPVAGGAARAQEALQPGEAVVTRFSGTAEEAGRLVIDGQGAVVSVVDLRQPGGPARGEHWFNALQRGAVTAAEIGQVFGVAIDDASPANIYLTATSAFGLHRNADNSDWMAGMWGAEGGPGTVWKLNGANGYQPELFAEITLDGRPNSGAALGNVAYDRWNGQLYVSDLETGMVHRLRLADGAVLGTYDHGVDGRRAFFDVPSGGYQGLAPVAFDPLSRARTADCPSGDFGRTPSCWNFADFRRRVWGLGVRRDTQSDGVRLYYALWSSQGFGNADFAGADDSEKRNAVWSIGIGPDGAFDPAGVRREFVLPDFFRSPEAIARSGFSHPVADIAFPDLSEQNVMLLAERGGVRNLGLAAENAFAYPHESRVLRYEMTDTGFWRGAGRYDVGYYDRGQDGPPYLRAGSAGGVSFGPGYLGSGTANPDVPDGTVWMTGDGLCSDRGRCFDSSSGAYDDGSEVHGLQGRAAHPFEAFEPVTAFQPYPAPGPVTPATGPDSSFMVDADVNTDPAGNVLEELRFRNDATRVGDVAVVQSLPAGGALLAQEDDPFGPVPWPEGLPPQGWVPAPLPPDGWFLPPPFPLDTDLAIRKTGPAQCQEGVECTYVVTLRNVGATTYAGPLAITDTMPAGATLASTSPGWNCAPIGVAFNCVTNAAALLPPGATAAIEVNLLLPATVPGPNVQNCVAIDWFEMGTDDGPGDGNDEDCVTTPVSEGFDLGIVKMSSMPDCTENADCTFLVQVINQGPGEFNGSLAVRDPLPAGSSLVLAGFDPATVTCSLSGTDVVCQTPDITLPVGGTVPMMVRIKLPDGIAGTTVENCARIDWTLMTSDDGPADVHPDEACVTVNVLDGAGHFDLSIGKQGPASCDAGGNCVYQVLVTNNGPDDYNDELVIRDEIDPGVTYVANSPGWTCVAGPPIRCALNGGPHLLHPGDQRILFLTVAIPDPAPADPLLDCVALDWGVGIMPPDDIPAPGATEKDDDMCVPTWIDDAFDLEIAKSGPPECYEGGACDFTVEITNNGPKDFMALMTFDDLLPAGATLESATGTFSCNSEAAGTVTCLNAGTMLPGESVLTTLTMRLPDPVAGNSVENCARMNWSAPPPAWYIGSTYSGDDNPATDGPACVSIPVLAADLAPWGATTCERGASCPIEVRVENRGGRLFSGAAGLRGTLDPAVAISSLQSRTPGFDCRVTGVGSYECDADSLTLKPESSVRIDMVLDIPKDFSHPRIVHRKEMVWPDLKVKDAKPENDRHTSTIMIVQPEDQPEEQEEQPQPEEPPVAQEPQAPVVPPSRRQVADLSVTKTAPQRSCTAGQPCAFQVTVTNNGPVPYTGPLQLSDVGTPASRRIASGPAPWRCRTGGGQVSCSHPVTTLAPGQSRTLSLSVRPPRGGASSLRNCASLDWGVAAQTRAVQDALNALGFDAGPVDGQAGPRTRGAVRAFQEQAGLPATGRIDGRLLGRLFVSWGSGDAQASNDSSCVTVQLRQPVEPPPSCASGQSEVAASRVRTLRAQGWRIAPVTRGGVTIYCGTPPQPQTVLTCPSGYTLYRNKNRVPRNSEVLQRRSGSVVYYCARPRPQAQTCPSGWKQVTPVRAAALAAQGWQVRRVGALTCVRPGQRVEPTVPNCTGGRVWNAKSKACVCPRNTRWDPKRNRCVRVQQQQPQVTPRQPRFVPPLQQLLPKAPQ
ncbi:peptidoglycan-binding protein [Roseibium sp. Sym1]|uniref:peptidoglycan-binding protein n=1 Tax=Roseibium sp. Sym1 TaxID=3016006 RepID=UPI0022B2F60A|nr:peptidoglycan-binding protein [Roseibium sp. Sym1]